MQKETGKDERRCRVTETELADLRAKAEAATPENFDEQIGRRIAHDNARAKIWALEGYLLRTRLSEKGYPARTPETCTDPS